MYGTENLASRYVLWETPSRVYVTCDCVACGSTPQPARRGMGVDFVVMAQSKAAIHSSTVLSAHTSCSRDRRVRPSAARDGRGLRMVGVGGQASAAAASAARPAAAGATAHSTADNTPFHPPPCMPPGGGREAAPKNEARAHGGAGAISGKPNLFISCWRWGPPCPKAVERSLLWARSQLHQNDGHSH